MSLAPKSKMVGEEKLEKQILREAFKDYLPDNILYRQKEQFSDGVGYEWINTLKRVVNENVTDLQFENAHHKYAINTPMTKEEYYYRDIFTSFFPSDSAALTVPSVPSVACSSEVALKWDESFKEINDPSGRAVITVHRS